MLPDLFLKQVNLVISLNEFFGWLNQSAFLSFIYLLVPQYLFVSLLQPRIEPLDFRLPRVNLFPHCPEQVFHFTQLFLELGNLVCLLLLSLLKRLYH